MRLGIGSATVEDAARRHLYVRLQQKRASFIAMASLKLPGYSCHFSWTLTERKHVTLRVDLAEHTRWRLVMTTGKRQQEEG